MFNHVYIGYLLNLRCIKHDQNPLHLFLFTYPLLFKMRGSIPPPWDRDLSRNRESETALTAPPRRPSLHPSNVAAGRLKMPSTGGILSLLGAGVLDHRFQASGFPGQAGSPKSDYQPSASLSEHHCTGDGCSDSREKEAIARLES